MFCANITLRRIRLQNPAFWNTHFYASKSILVAEQHSYAADAHIDMVELSNLTVHCLRTAVLVG